MSEVLKVGRTVPGEPRVLTGSAGTPRPTRKPLGHGVPAWVETGSIFFITVCVVRRDGAPLLQRSISQGLLESVRYLHRSGTWFAHLFVVMPDHVHGLISFPPEETMASRIAAWKSYTKKNLQVEWQERFFDHRLRSDESLEEKADYIRMNPVRARLVTAPEQWPHVFDAFEVGRTVPGEPRVLTGSAGTPRPTI